MAYKVVNGKVTKPSMHLYFESHPNDSNMCVYGQTTLDFTPKSKSEAFNHIKKNRVSTGMGKWKRALLNTGAVKLHATLDITNYAKLTKSFDKKKKLDDHLVFCVTTEDERSTDGGEYVYISPQELFDRIVTFISSYTGEEVEVDTFQPNLIKPRCDLHKLDIQKFKDDFHKFLRDNGLDPNNLDKIGYSKLSGHFLQVWACGSGKSTTPMLVYMECFEDKNDYKTSFPINLVTSPTLKVLKGNLIKQASHDLARGAKSVHIAFTSGISSTDDPRTLTELESLGIEVIKDRSKFKEIMEKYKDCTVWLYTTYHSYYNRDRYRNPKKNCLTYLMNSIGRDFYFAYIDEYHKTLQPNRQPWSAVHYDDICRIQFRFKCSASKPKFKGNNKTNYEQIFHIGENNDVIFNPLTIKESYKRGYTRSYKVLDFLINDVFLNSLQSKEHNLIEVIKDKKHPNVAVTDKNGEKIIVHHSYYWHIICYLYTIFSGMPIKHTLATCNEVAHANLYRDFFVAVRPILVEAMCKGNKNHPMYDILMNIYVDVMDTKEEANSVKIFERIDEIPAKYSHSLIIHCYVAETGWNPGDTLQYKNKKVWEKQQGFINCVTFIDPVNSMARIQQNAGRGARAKHISDTCYLLLHHLIDFDTDPNPYNTRFKKTRLALNALEIGEEELHDVVTFFDFTRIHSAPTGGKAKGDKYPDFMFEIGSVNGVDEKWLKFRENNDFYTPLFDWLDKACLRFIELDKLHHGYLLRTNAKKVEKILKQEFPQFSNYSSNNQYYDWTKGLGTAVSILQDDVYEAITNHRVESKKMVQDAYEDVKHIVLESIQKQPYLSFREGKDLVYKKYGINWFTIKKVLGSEVNHWQTNKVFWKNQKKKVYQFIFDFVMSDAFDGTANSCLTNFHQSNISSFEVTKASIKTWMRDISKGSVFNKLLTVEFNNRRKVCEKVRKSGVAKNLHKKDKILIECPHCKAFYTKGQIKQHHGDKCYMKGYSIESFNEKGRVKIYTSRQELEQDGNDYKYVTMALNTKVKHRDLYWRQISHNHA